MSLTISAVRISEMGTLGSLFILTPPPRLVGEGGGGGGRVIADSLLDAEFSCPWPFCRQPSPVPEPETQGVPELLADKDLIPL